MDHQVTTALQNHILTNTAVWCPNSEWIVYDVRSDPTGSQFDGNRIEAVHTLSGEIRLLFESINGAHCGVPSWHPIKRKVIFILGPENPTSDWSYSECHRQGVIVDWNRPGFGHAMEACDLVDPFTPGSLRGGTHVHIWDAAGDWITFTYNDALVDSELRDVGVSIPDREVNVSDKHPRNHSGSHFSFIVTKTKKAPIPESDEIHRACEESWVGHHGYLRADGSRSSRALAFQGQVITSNGQIISEVFLCDLPKGTAFEEEERRISPPQQRPSPPIGINQRRLTFTTNRKYPGLQGPRHWLRSAPDGSAIGCLMRDDDGIVQLWLVSPNGGPPRQLTNNAWPISSAFHWSPDGRSIAHGMDGSICVTNTSTGKTQRLTDSDQTQDKGPPRPEACVFSPDSRKIAYVRPMTKSGHTLNQIFYLALPND